MIVDSHTHIFPKMFKEDREGFFEQESEFKLLYENKNSRLCEAEELIKVMDKQGVDKSVVFGFPWRNPETIKRHNDYILEAMNSYPGRFYGLACVDMQSDTSGHEVDRCLKAGFHGVGELALYQGSLTESILNNLDSIMALCSQQNVPVLIHSNEPVGHQYPGKATCAMVDGYSLARRYPDNKIILAHWGGGLFFFNLLKKETKSVLSNVYFDTAASPFLYDTEIYSVAVNIIGADRILFGSDHPLIEPERYFREMQASGLSEQELKQIKGLNAQKLFS